MSFETVAQQVIYGLLSNSADVMSAVKGVYDSVPDQQDFPYITIGEDDNNEWDTATTLGNDVVCTVSVWSRDRGKKETKDIQGRIYNALHRQDYNVTGYQIISIDWQNSTSFLDYDAKTRHGVQTFRILIDKEG